MASSSSRSSGSIIAVEDILQKKSSNVSSSSSNSDDSESVSSNDSESYSDSESDTYFGEVTQEYLDSLLNKARDSLEAKSKGKEKEKMQFGDEEIKLGGEDDELSDRELPPLDPGNLPGAYFDPNLSEINGIPTARDVEAEKLEKASNLLRTPSAPPPPPEVDKNGRKLTKKEIKAQKETKLGWFDLPTHSAGDLPRLYKEVEALRLRNTLDPKRFYKKEEGEGKGIKGLPKTFAIGTILPTSTAFGGASSDNLTRAERKRTLVDELVDDAEAKRYAKKKFQDLQTTRGARGRGTLAKKNLARKPKW